MCLQGLDAYTHPCIRRWWDYWTTCSVLRLLILFGVWNLCQSIHFNHASGTALGFAMSVCRSTASLSTGISQQLLDWLARLFHSWFPNDEAYKDFSDPLTFPLVPRQVEFCGFEWTVEWITLKLFGTVFWFGRWSFNFSFHHQVKSFPQFFALPNSFFYLQN